MSIPTITHVQYFTYDNASLIRARGDRKRSVIAAALGVSTKQIERVESGESGSLTLVEALCRLYGLDVKAIVSEIQAPIRERRGRPKKFIPV